jgi:uncharacterized membrane protein YiaA
MKRIIFYNWLVLAITSFLVGIYISIFEHVLKDKGYLYFIMALLFAVIFYYRRKKGDGKQ